MVKLKRSIILLLILLIIIGGCSSKDNDQEFEKTMPDKIKIALQYGLGYAPVQIMKEKNLIEKYLPGVIVEWKQQGSGGAIREALISGNLDVGFMGIPPFLIGWDKGAKWKIATAINSSPLGLQTYKNNIQSLADFSEEDKIALPSPGSVQHILLSMAAEKELGDPNALDTNIVSMAHPDGATSLISNRNISAHFTSPPYIFEELEDGKIKQIVNGEDAFGGENTFLVGVATEKFHNNYPAAYAAFIAAVNEAITFINNNPDEAASLLADDYGLSEEVVKKYLTWPGMNYTSTPYGLLGYAEFMKEAEYISNIPTGISEIAWENVSAIIGKKSGEKSILEKAQYRD